MNEKTPWLGMCRIDKDEESFETIIAVFGVDREVYEKSVKALMESKGFHLVWAEEVFPAGEWITRHPKERSASGLARAVHERHLVEVGTLRAVGEEGEPAPDPEYLTITEHEIPPLPEQDDVPFWDKEWIAPELKELLFGQPEEGETLRTYFIVDATLRKSITGVFDLDALDVPVQCLFKGEKAEELKEVAPYLIDMTLPDGAWDDKDTVPAFHKDFFDKHWGQNTGIFIRTSALFEYVWKHFRKFLRIQVEEDKRWVYFRFWDSRIAPSYFSSIKDTPEKVAQWIYMRGAVQIDSFVGNQIDGSDAWEITPEWSKLKNVPPPVGNPMLSDPEIKGFEKYALQKKDAEIATYLLNTSQTEKLHDLKKVNSFVSELRTYYTSIGFRSLGDCKKLILTDFTLGVNFYKSIIFSYLSKDYVLRNPVNMFYGIMEHQQKALEFKVTLHDEFDGNTNATLTEPCVVNLLEALSQKSVMHAEYIKNIASTKRITTLSMEKKNMFILASVYLGEFFHLDPIHKEISNRIISPILEGSVLTDINESIYNKIIVEKNVAKKGIFR